MTPSSVYANWLEAIEGADWIRFEQHLDEAAVFTFTHRLPDDSARVRGRAAIVDSFTRWRSGFVHLHGAVVDSIEDAERAAFQVWWTGTTVTGRPVGFASCHWVTAEDSRLVAVDDYFDQTTYDAMVGR